MNHVRIFEIFVRQVNFKAKNRNFQKQRMIRKIAAITVSSLDAYINFCAACY